MSGFDDVDRILGGDYASDHWSDERVLVAADLFDALDDEGWDELLSSYESRPAQWQERLADALLGPTTERARTLLAALLRSTRSDVAAAAANSLYADRAWRPDPDLRPVLERLAGLVPTHRDVVEALLAREPPSSPSRE